MVVWVAVAELLRQGRLSTVLSAGRAELAAPLLVALVVATGVCERIWPAERRPALARGHVQDACFLALHAIVVIPLMTLLSVGAAALIGGHAGWVELRSTAHWPGWLLVPLTVVAMDAANWLAHYADHRLDPLFPARGDAVGSTGLNGRPVPVEQGDAAGPALRLLAGQLIEPFHAQG